MTTTAAAVLALTVALDWLAVSRQWARVEQVAKPLVMVALGWLALTMGALTSGAVTSGAVTSGAVTSAATHPATGRLLLVAVLFSLIGDVFLLGRTAVRFAGGLVSFLVAHIAYVAAFLAQGFHPLWALPGLLVALPLGAISGRRIVRAATREGGAALGGAVTTYMVVIVAMVATAGGTARPIVLLGALIFLVSDTVLATDRFVGPRAHARIVVMVTYHLGQVLMVVGALR